MAKFISEVLQIAQDDFISSSTAKHKLGTRAVSDDGRVFRYVKAGAADLVAGNVIQSPAIVANHLATSATAAAVGATSISFTPGATAGVADLYADGFLQVDTGAGAEIGYTYGVSTHPAITASTAFTLTLKDPIQVALVTTTSKLGLIRNKYSGVIQMPVTTATGVVVGVATYIITAAQFGWIQTWGTCSVLTAGTPALGTIVMAPGAVAGSVAVVVAAGNLVVGQLVGQMAQVGVDTKINFVDLRVNP